MSYPLPDLAGLGEALRAGDRPLAVGGIVPGARALVVAALHRQGTLPPRSLVVVPHVAEADDLVAGLAILAPGLSVGSVPAEGASPYQGTEPPLASRLELTRLLLRLASDDVDIVVAPARALLAPIPGPSDLPARTVRVAIGDELDTGDLSRRLAHAGYRRVDLVEEAGEFAVRGWVVDLHPGGDEAIRLELDDVIVDRIQAFDPATQRSTGDPVAGVEIAPLEPFPAGAPQCEAVAAALEDGYPALAGLLRSGADRRLWWGALALAGRRTSWLEELNAVLLCDRDEAFGEIGRWWKVQDREWRTLAERNVDLPGPDVLMCDVEAVRHRLDGPELRIEGLEVSDGSTRWWRLATHPTESYVRRIPDLVPTLRHRRALDLAQVLVVGSEGEGRRFHHLLVDGEVVPVAAPPPLGDVAITVAELERGFRWDGGLVLYGRRDLTAAPRPRRRRSGLAAFVSDLRDLRPGDVVVHMDHGIGRFTGFRRIAVEGRQLEMMVLAYRGDDTLLVPVERADLIHKYAAGDSEGAPPLDRLGGSTWRRRQSRVKRAVREMAAELLRLAAVRRATRGFEFSPDSPWQREFEDAFPYELTPDQERAAQEIKADMESALPMDRLLCGDVGYGKTEVAIRAAFKAVLDGKQVAVLAPTTILAEQHLDTFRQRFEGFPVEARMLSRFTSGREAKETLAGLAEGQVDLVVGTHRLLSSDVRFRDLGLVILDEEQRFGVAQKERLKKLRTEVDVVAMSATPIPRTLNLSLTGLRDISLIETPPRDRQAVETSVLEFSEDVVREAILYEMQRSGQVFFVHNRVRSIGVFAEWLRRVVPEARVAVAHGQMPERALEKAMRTFLDGDADVLLATAIIENGLDIANANTLLVNRADRFGLAQLYQLRGRVGRSDRLAFAYFLVPPGQPLSPTARARLAAVQEFCELGAGFRIAARDLEIRGAGNLLGAEQHGFMEAVGFETYCRLLEEAVAELEGREAPAPREIELRLGIELQLPEAYIPEPSLRLSFYKRLASVADEGALRDLLDEVVDRYGPAPQQLANLASAQRIRMAARAARVTAVVRRAGEWRLQLDPTSASAAPLVAAAARRPGLRVTPSGELVVAADPDDPLLAVGSLLEELAADATAV